ncbi:hypothetical protein VTJ49DRAFT_4171 [Mycothermus thermophilus]|uniref:Uncharacterized protein n=1 Tax=Humicola insolens TaxID=85995 RepID=A0ABR3V607_HUMIN
MNGSVNPEPRVLPSTKSLYIPQTLDRILSSQGIWRFRPSKLPRRLHRRLRRSSRCRAQQLPQCPLGQFCRGVQRLAVHVEPRAVDDELHVLGQVEDGGDQGEGGEEEDDRVCWPRGFRLAQSEALKRGSFVRGFGALGERKKGMGRRTKDELLGRCKHVDTVGDLELVDLELQPLAEGLESGGHGGRVGEVGFRITRWKRGKKVGVRA